MQTSPMPTASQKACAPFAYQVRIVKIITQYSFYSYFKNVSRNSGSIDTVGHMQHGSTLSPRQ